MDHIGQILTIVGAVVVPIAGAFAAWLRAMARKADAVAKNIAANNRGQNAALREIRDGMAQAGTLPPPVAEPAQPRNRDDRASPYLATPIRGVPIIDIAKGDDDAK